MSCVYHSNKNVKQIKSKDLRFNNELSQVEILYNDEWKLLVTDAEATVELTEGEAKYEGCLIWKMINAE